MTRFSHVLIVGGSGMLAGLGRKLLERCDTLSILARNEARIRAVSPSVTPQVCDYRDAAAVEAALAADAKTHGPPDLIVAWIHPRAPELRRRLARAVAPGGRFAQVLGSAVGDPAHPDRLAAMTACADGAAVVQQAVLLGFVIAGGPSRWLTNDEISEGVFTALESGAPVSTVGTLTPWSARP